MDYTLNKPELWIFKLLPIKRPKSTSGIYTRTYRNSASTLSTDSPSTELYILLCKACEMCEIVRLLSELWHPFFPLRIMLVFLVTQTEVLKWKLRWWRVVRQESLQPLGASQIGRLLLEHCFHSRPRHCDWDVQLFRVFSTHTCTSVSAHKPFHVHAHIHIWRGDNIGIRLGRRKCTLPRSCKQNTHTHKKENPQNKQKYKRTTTTTTTK